MEHTFWSLVAILAVSQSRAQQQASPLGIKYSQSTDVSHTSFNSPLVSYGDSLSAIQLPAAPLRPANLRESSQETQEGQTFARTFGNQEEQTQTQQSSTQPRFYSIQQFPANPQLQQNDQDISARAQPAGNQQQQYVQPQQRFAESQQPFGPQQQFLTPEQSLYNQQQILASQQPYVQQQQFAAPQQPYVQQQQFATPQQSYVSQQSLDSQQSYVPQQQFAAPQFQQQYSPSGAYPTPQSNGYFATGPYAAQPQLQYPQQQAAVARQQAPALTQPPFVSRVAFNGPVTGFSYQF